MAQVYKEFNITNINLSAPAPGGRTVQATHAAYIYESVASTIGSGANRPYCGLFLQLTGIGGSAPFSTSDAGRCRTEVIYTDDSMETLTDNDSPLRGQNVQTGAGNWFNVHGDGSLKTFGTPTAASTLSSSTTASARERLPLNASKTPKEFVIYWTDN